ncbi:flavin monoamine oxidase family protein [Kordiimonas pumila]|uniref:NAD(P)-binding protein n=1 Tax=Kordiimonas pumila TaxID=2161677 RepID=A0ABV7D8H6_9PROT|nr:FAD/NAD(P)-binding protein [Kordiimonas pumila]
MKKLGNIDRREFLSGVAAASVLVATPGITTGLLADPVSKWVYPPAKTGLRGTHEGSFEAAHQVAWAGEQFERPQEITDKPYDMVIVGAGISGLSAAVMAQEKLGSKARILLLDNHDDFGGHAKRNEFTVDGKKLIGYGGSQSIDTPSHYSPVAASFLKKLTIDVEKFYRYYDRSYYSRRHLGDALYLNAKTYGVDSLYVRRDNGGYNGFWNWDNTEQKAELAAVIQDMPLSSTDKTALTKLFIDRIDWLAEMSLEEKKAYLRSHSFESCLRDNLGLSDKALHILRVQSYGLWGLGWDAISGLEVYRMGDPATFGLGLDDAHVETSYGDDPYIFHFPDGNASIARLCVAKLIPDAIGDVDMDSVVPATVHYDRLDRDSNAVRIRLSSIAVDARNTADGVEVTYVRDGKTEKIAARYGIMACWNNILPHIMPEMAAPQKEALKYAEKVPLVYTNVALRNWRAFEKAGVSSFFAPGNLITSGSLDFPVSMGGYLFPHTSDEPIVMHMLHVPTRRGLPSRQQHREGRHDLLALTFEDYEADIVSLLDGGFGTHGLDVERDIAAITVNRWPHGYAYEYNELFDPIGWGPKQGPHVKGRETIGNLAIANADASAYAYVNGAIDAADRALASLL